MLPYRTQTITGAMSTLTPPLEVEKPENQDRLDYIQDVASGPDFEFTEVTVGDPIPSRKKRCILRSIVAGVLGEYRSAVARQRSSHVLRPKQRVPAH